MVLNLWIRLLTPNSALSSVSLVWRFKFFSTIYGEKCCLFFRHFSPKGVVKNSKYFHYFVSSRWKIQKEAQKRWKDLNFSPNFCWCQNIELEKGSRTTPLSIWMKNPSMRCSDVKNRDILRVPLTQWDRTWWMDMMSRQRYEMSDQDESKGGNEHENRLEIHWGGWGDISWAADVQT
jgi:hypothetical protein